MKLKLGSVIILDKETIDDIILAQENKACNLQIRYHF